MITPENFVVVNGIAHYCPQGVVTFPEILILLRGALAVCREAGIKKILIDGTKLTGFPIPTIMNRFDLGEQLATDAKGASLSRS